MKNQGIRKLLARLFLLSLPMLLLLGGYLWKDPFKVIRKYDSYYDSMTPPFVALNRDYVSTETFLRHYRQYQWDSFIFGNSRSIFYEVKAWSGHIHSDRTFHFDASVESLYGIARKVEFLEQNHVPIRNALIILDASTLSEVGNTSGHLFVKDPRLSGEGWCAFQSEFLKAFCSSAFLAAYLRMQLSHHATDDSVLDSRPFDYDLQHNELRFGCFETLIATNPDAYYTPRLGLFHDRPAKQAMSCPVIHEPQKAMLRRISQILAGQQAEVRIVISPLYDQKPFNPEDLACLKGLFGQDKVFDFSGINDITNERTNYYESSHYRPHVAQRILSTIYAQAAP